MDEGLKPWGFELEEYIREGEPDKAARADAWQTAIGLQDVDGLKPSRYLLDIATEHIEGRISIDDAERRIESYYQKRSERTEGELESEEADVVSARIAKMLGEQAFSFSPVTWKNIHGKLFKGLIKRAGSYRDYNISKREWVLKGDTVRYAAWDSIGETVEYDFEKERAFSYKRLSQEEVVEHIAKFIAGIWQIHPFPEGNTRTTAVFAIQYLNSFGYNVNNEPFAAHSWFFRNALVRANYSNLDEGVSADYSFLEAFFENLLLGKDNELKNRYMHIDWKGEQDSKSATEQAEQAEQVTEQVTEQVARLLEALGNDELTAAELMERVGLRHRPTFSYTYLRPAIELGLVEMTIPDKPRSRFQKYRKVAR